MMRPEDFERLCLEEASKAEQSGEGIGTYSEKRLHRVLKRWITEDETCFEMPVGRSIADVVTEEGIFEIQTSSLRPLFPKLCRYIETTDMRVCVILPLFAKRRVVRMDRQTGEILRSRTVYRGGKAIDALPRLYDIRALLSEPQLSVVLVRLEADEFRYSERVRYRREGAYESELFPRCLCETVTLRSPEDYRIFLPEERSFYATEYAAWSKLKKRDLYSALNLLCELGLLKREQEGRKYRYEQI